jgi:SAM-dependent methyltransferase
MPALRALLIQIAATALALASTLTTSRLGWLEPSLIGWAVQQALFAATLATLLHVDRWWLPLHLGFAPCVAIALHFPVPPAVYLALLGILLLVFGLPFRTRVPLFLSSRTAVSVIAAWLPKRSYSVLDVGSGTGRFVTELARLRGDCQVCGLELAWLPWCLSRLAVQPLANARVHRADFWKQPLETFDVVYAFLSPVPMPALWDKARRELRPGSWLISNSFAVPGARPTEILEVNDRRHTRLYCYRIPDRSNP